MNGIGDKNGIWIGEQGTCRVEAAVAHGKLRSVNRRGKPLIWQNPKRLCCLLSPTLAFGKCKAGR